MLSICQICKENFHPFGDVMDDLTRSWDVCLRLAFNQVYQNFCDLIGYMIYISGYKQTLVRFRLRSEDSEKRYF